MRSITGRQKLLIRTLSVLLLSFIIFSLNVMAWETPIVIASNAGHTYEKPEMRFAPSGAVYIVYEDNNELSGNSDIYMCTYDGKKMNYENVSNSVQFFNKHRSYESDIDVTDDGRIHVAWVVQNRNIRDVHYIKYRYKDNNTWSNIVDLGAVNMREDDFVYDFRLGVSNNGNVHVILSRAIEVGVLHAARYGSTVTAVERLGTPGVRVKHPDIAVDDNYVHAAWMHKLPEDYVIMYQKWENKLGSVKGTQRQVAFPGADYGCEKARINLDSDGYFHLVVFFASGLVKKLRYTRELPTGALTPYVTLSNPEKLMLYHWAGIEVRDDSTIATMQVGPSTGGTGLYYNWKKGGQWGGYQPLPDTKGAVHQSVDLTSDGKIAAVAFGKYDNAIMLTSSEKISGTGSLEVQFTHPTMVFWGSDVILDASQCVSLNPDYNIVSYKWDFGDGHTETNSHSAASHQFDTYGTDVRVTLTITAETGQTGTISKDIHIHALYNAIITAQKKMQVRTLFHNRPAYEIQWTANSKNSLAGYPTITKYEIWRAQVNTGAANTGSGVKYGTRIAPGKPLSPAVAATNYIYVGEVDAGVTRFLDYFGLQDGTNYVYSIRSADEQGHKSPFDNI